MIYLGSRSFSLVIRTRAEAQPGSEDESANAPVSLYGLRVRACSAKGSMHQLSLAVPHSVASRRLVQLRASVFLSEVAYAGSMPPLFAATSNSLEANRFSA